MADIGEEPVFHLFHLFLGCLLVFGLLAFQYMANVYENQGRGSQNVQEIGGISFVPPWCTVDMQDLALRFIPMSVGIRRFDFEAVVSLGEL